MIPRRTLVTAGPLTLASCVTGHAAYFGKTTPPSRQRLVYEIGGEPESLDPHLSIAGTETYIIPSLFEGLVTWHPRTAEPQSGIATHYEPSPDHRRFTFFLRGHSAPRGVRLPGTESLDSEFTRGKTPLPHTEPARFSDGTPIRARDVVYSWRRAIRPQTGAALVSFMFPILHAPEINAGRRPIEDLGVREVDEYTVQVDLHSPTPFFVSLQFLPPFYIVPRHAIEAARASGAERSWTRPDRIVTSGPFTMAEWKPYHSVRLARNNFYYDAPVVGLNEVVLLPIPYAETNLNLYKAGEADSMLAKLVAPVYVPTLRRKKDFNSAPAFWTMFYVVNTTRPPFDNVLVRYALNMAIDKNAIASVLAGGQRPARTLVASLPGYQPVDSLAVTVDGTVYNVLEYNPRAARALLRKAGVKNLRIDILYPQHPASQDVPLILREQWQGTLGAEVHFAIQEQKAWHETRNALRYSGVAERGWWGDYLDPTTFLDPFTSGSSIIGSGWSDRQYDAMLADANATPNVSTRMRKLAGCEEYMLRSMPILPLYHNAQAYLQKPYVRGLPRSPIDGISFKYAWIDTNWRPS